MREETSIYPSKNSTSKASSSSGSSWFSQLFDPLVQKAGVDQTIEQIREQASQSSGSGYLRQGEMQTSVAPIHTTRTQLEKYASDHIFKYLKDETTRNSALNAIKEKTSSGGKSNLLNYFKDETSRAELIDFVKDDKARSDAIKYFQSSN